jgi:hypothetical protein
VPPPTAPLPINATCIWLIVTLPEGRDGAAFCALAGIAQIAHSNNSAETFML